MEKYVFPAAFSNPAMEIHRGIEFAIKVYKMVFKKNPISKVITVY